jgi:hypothetical protein
MAIRISEAKVSNGKSITMAFRISSDFGYKFRISKAQAFFRIGSTSVLFSPALSLLTIVDSSAASAPFNSPNFKSRLTHTHTHIKFAGTSSVFPIFQVPLE